MAAHAYTMTIIERIKTFTELVCVLLGDYTATLFSILGLFSFHNHGVFERD